MRPAPALPWLGPLAAALLLLASPVRAAQIRLISADPSGVTLRLDIGRFDLSAPGPDGRSTLEVPAIDLLDQPGRPQVPFDKAIIALPPGARAVAHVVDEGAPEVREGVKLAIGQKTAYHVDPSGLGFTPSVEDVAPVLDGPWPATEVVVGEPFDLRRQRVAVIEVHPFSYDEAAGRLTIRRTLTVRVDFRGGSARTSLAAGTEDRYFEPVLKGAVLNYQQGLEWRAAPPLEAATLEPATRRAAPAGSAAAFAFDEGQSEVRVKLDSTGVWAIGFDDLAAHGFPANVPIGEVSVHRHEFIEDAAVPYVTIEVPIELDDAGTPGVFDSGDRIVMYAQSWAQRSGASIPQRNWGDAEVVYVTSLPGGAGLRMGARNGAWSAPPSARLFSYPFAHRYEKNFADFITFPGDTLTDPWDWTQLMLYYDRQDTILFETNHIDTTHAVVFSTTLQGRNEEPRYNWETVKNGLGQVTQVFDSTTAVWSGLGSFTISATLNGSAFTEGLTNALGQWGRMSIGPPDPTVNRRTDSGLNYFIATYWRRFVALAGSLDCNSADTSGIYEIRAQGFSDPSTLRAYDVTNPLDPRRLTGVAIAPGASGYDLTLQDSTAAGARRHYIVFDTPHVVPADHVTTVTRRQLENHTAGDYLLVVPEAFLPAVQPLVDLRTAQGMSVVVAPLEGINDEFNGGRHADFAVRRFIRYAYNRWNARFVILVGDGAGEDPQNIGQSSGFDWIPTHMIQGPVGVFLSASYRLEAVPSDPWYVWCLNCADPSLAPKLHDLYIGRLPVNSLAEATSVIQKVVAYESAGADESWRRRMLLFADDEFSGETTFGGSGGGTTYCQKDYEARFRQLSEKVRSVILDEAGLKQSEPEVFELGYWLRNEPIVVTPCTPPCDPDTCRPDRAATISRTRAAVTGPQLMTRLNAGRLWWNFQGHANEQVLSHESFYLNSPSSDDRDLFMNSGKPFLFSAFSCHSNNFGRRWEKTAGFNPGPSLGEDMVTAPNGGGAIASWASVGYEIIPSNGFSHINVEFARALFASPPRDPYLGSGGTRVVLGQAVALALTRWLAVPGVGTDSYQRNVGITYTLLGDPATRLSIGAPQMLVTANGDTVTDGVPVRLHTLGDTLRLEADLVSNQEITALSLEKSVNGGAVTVLPGTDYTLAPAFPDTGLAGSGGRRYHLVYRTSLTSSSYRFTFRTTDRDGSQGRFDALFQFQSVLRADGTTVNAGDPVSPGANMSLLVLSPAPIDPKNDLTLAVNGNPVTFDTLAVAGEPSRREWVLSWTHAPFAIGPYQVQLVASGGATATHPFIVNIGSNELKIENLLAFPNPFDDDLGTRFSFDLETGSPTDIEIRVYTVNGRLVYTRIERGLLTGRGLQIAWDGRDADGDRLANGIYFYRLLARNASASLVRESRLVKLRRPHRTVEPVSGTP